jgi:hypothetical protein
VITHRDGGAGEVSSDPPMRLRVWSVRAGWSSRIGEALLVTVAASTKPDRRPARRHRRWRHTRSVVVTLDGA